MNVEEVIVRKTLDGYQIKTKSGWLSVLTVKETAQALNRSPRQVYRLIADDKIKHWGKFLGDWLIDLDSVTLLKRNPKLVGRLIARLQTFFPEYDLNSLNLVRDRSIIVCRILDQGSIKDLKWLYEKYSTNLVKEIIRQHGPRLLSKRALNFWSVYFELKIEKNWRSQSNPWVKRNEVA